MVSYYIYDTEKYPFERIIQEIYSEKYNFTENLNNLHFLLENLPNEEKKELLTIPLLGINDRKSRFVKDYYSFVDNNERFNICYMAFMKDIIKRLFPQEDYILYQKTPNLRISFPGTTAIGRRDSDPSEEIIGLHKDGDFGHSDQEINFIIPITEMYDTNSIYYEKNPNANTEIEDFENLVLVKNTFFKCFFNKQRHYNKINDTGKTRISLDIRIIPFSKYEKSDKQSISSQKKLELGDYFSII